MLLLDPGAEILELLAPLLEEEGIPVRVVGGQNQALAALDAGAAGLILVGTEGSAEGVRDFLDEVRDRPGRVPVVVVTGPLDRHLLQGLLEAGAADVVPRPIQADQLAIRVRELCLAAARPAEGPRIPTRAVAGNPAEFGELGLHALAALRAWLVVVGPDLAIRLANRSFAAALASNPSMLIGADLETALLRAVSDAGPVLDRVRAVLAREAAEHAASLGFRVPGGEERIVDLTVTAITHERRRHAVLVMHDVTDLWRSQQGIERERRKLQEIVDGMGAALGVLDPELKVVWANRTFRQWFGELWGRRFDHALRGLVLVGDADPARVFTEREYVSREWAHYTAEGDKRYYRNIILPAHDETGRLRELVLVTQDLTQVTLRAEQHRLLQELAGLLQSTLELPRLLYIILTCSTAGHALGFNRAFLFLADEDAGELRGVMGVGPASREEAFMIWAELAGSRRSLDDLTSDYDRFRDGPQVLTGLVSGLRYPLLGAGAEREILARTWLENRTHIVRDSATDPRVTPDFRGIFGVREFVSVPLASKGRVVGVLLADNLFSNRPIHSGHAELLELFAATAGLAVDNARTYERLRCSLAELEEAQERLLQSERLATVGSLAAHVAHEIRNPLTTIGGFARSVLRSPGDAERVRRNSEIIVEEVVRLEDLLSEVMDFTRPARPQLRAGDLNAVVRDLLPSLEPETRDAGIDLSVELDPDLPPVLVDAAQIRQVLVNLVRNAREALERLPEGAPRALSIRTRPEGGRVELVVADGGPGIPPDLLPAIFDPFVSRKTRGTGLGLAVVRKILMDHGGDARAENGEGGGARFTLSLPAAGAGRDGA